MSRYGILQRCSIVPDFAPYARNNIPNDSHPLVCGMPRPCCIIDDSTAPLKLRES